jgi:Kef-type K+ transport system membrane component KefB
MGWKNLLFYVVVLLIFGTGIYVLLQFGSHLQAGASASQKRVESPSSITFPSYPPQSAASSSVLGKVLHENLRHPLSILLLQVIVIILTTRVIGTLFLKMKQPAVMGEMVAGILLGPSFIGLLFPEVQAFLFPVASMDALRLLSQIGVILFMFVVGMELDVQHIHQKAHAAVLVSHASIIVPFFLGTAFSLLIYRSLAPAHISFSAFALFMGISMSITAFPVLARIIEERGLSKSYLGSIAIACAAVDDVTAWCLLAVVVAIAQAHGLSGATLTVILTLLFIGLMLFLFRPQAGRIFGKEVENETQSKGLMAGVLTFAFAAALFTEVIGIHALFGAFLAGVILPAHARLSVFLRERLETFSSVFLLPLFFAFTGLRTQIGLLDDWQSWCVCAGVVAVAIGGKFGGSTLAARWTGMSWHDALSIGALMNTRGLMELIALNIGYDLGILSPHIFAMMVLMALTTTFMAGPLLWLFELWKRREALVTPETGIAA